MWLAWFIGAVVGGGVMTWWASGVSYRRGYDRGHRLGIADGRIEANKEWTRSTEHDLRMAEIQESSALRAFAHSRREARERVMMAVLNTIPHGENDYLITRAEEAWKWLESSPDD